ncbi:hypothetical protein [Paenibacillus sp. V4I3]|uniref:hypothetical protein n=1 Tax=Paenibacillus sp. V4I3 TaxID=3042305 RepID=UPI0027D85391|nr:hypothetical protein [Paenibacillus sp. V4I3]
MSSMGAGQPAIISAQQIVDSWEEGLNKLQAIHHQWVTILWTCQEMKQIYFAMGQQATIYLIRPAKM